MLDGFASGGHAPFLLSDAFPNDLMPIPMHIEALLVANKPRKKRRRPLYIDEHSFRHLLRGEFPVLFDLVENPSRPFGLLRTAIDRELGTAAEGRLFETDTHYLDKHFDSLSVYIRSDKYLKEVLACFSALALTGFGKKSSTGLGAFQILGMPQPCDWLDDSSRATGFVSLSHFVPAFDDPTEGCWNTHVTYPKFHANAVSNVFKETTLMLTPGSVFRINDGPPRSSYGRMISASRPEMPKALHYGLCFAVPLTWRTDDVRHLPSSTSVLENAGKAES